MAKTKQELEAEIKEAVGGAESVAMAIPVVSKVAKDIEAAVMAARLYIGKGLTMRISDEQKLYRRMNSKIAAVARRRGMDESDAYRQIMSEAKRRGGILASPGKDI